MNESFSKMNWVQVSWHLDYLLDKIRNNQSEDEMMTLIHCFSGYLLGNRNYLDEISQKKMTRYGLLCKLKDDICEQTHAPANPLSSQVIKDFTAEICKIVYRKE